METTALISKLLEMGNTKSMRYLLSKGFKRVGSEFFMLNDDLREYFRKEFDVYWSYYEMNYDLENIYQKTLKINKVHAKHANREVAYNLFCDAFYGRLYEFAKGNNLNEEIAKSIKYNERTGYWRLTKDITILKDITMSVLMPGYTAIAIIVPEKREANEKYEETLKQYKEQISHSELQNNKIKNLRKLVNKVRIDAKKPERTKLNDIAQKCKKKNGTLNYKKIGEMLGITNHTAKAWCREYKIK